MVPGEQTLCALSVIHLIHSIGTSPLGPLQRELFGLVIASLTGKMPKDLPGRPAFQETWSFQLWNMVLVCHVARRIHWCFGAP